MTDTPISARNLPSLSIPLFVSWIMVLAACSETGESRMEPVGYSVRDSAGVAIIESTDPAWGEGEAWTLTEEPLLSIGAVEGPDEYILFRSSSAIQLDDGRIVVANGASQDILDKPESR